MNTVTFKYGILKVQDGFSLMAPFWRHVALQTRDNFDHADKLAPTHTSPFCFFHAKVKQCRCWWSWIFISICCYQAMQKKQKTAGWWIIARRYLELFRIQSLTFCWSVTTSGVLLEHFHKERAGKYAWLWHFSCHSCLICVERVIWESKQFFAEHLWSKMSFAHVNVQHSHFTREMRDYCYCCRLKLQSSQLKGFSV